MDFVEPVFEKLANFRQAGGHGLQNKHGQKLKSGLIYRSSRPDLVTHTDRDLIQKLGIKAVFDLRYADEYRGSNGDKLLDEVYQLCTLRGTTVIPHSVGEEVNYVGRHYLMSLWGAHAFKHSIPQVYKNWFMCAVVTVSVVCLAICDKLFKTRYASHFFIRHVLRHFSLAQMYLLALENSKPTINKILRMLLVEKNVPVLINCAIGKDRTGVLVAIILACLEVADEDIAADYAESEVSVVCEEGSTDHDLCNCMFRKVWLRSRIGSIMKWWSKWGLRRRPLKHVLKP